MLTAPKTGSTRNQRLGRILLPALGLVLGIVIGMALSGLIFGASRSSPLPQSLTPGQPSAEVLALRAQLQTMREYDQRIIGVVYWGLGTAAALVVAFTVILIGFNWFSNVRLIDRDKADLREELQVLVEQQFTKRRDEIVAAAASANAAEISKVRGEVATVSSQFRAMHRRVLELQYDWERRRAKGWETGKPVPILENAITANVRAALIALELERDSWVEDTLEDIERLLAAKTGSPSPNTAARVAELLSKLAPEYGPIAGRIKAML
jgi:hypothetical protein